jgi:DNA-binding response OmpR family regulator
MDANKEVTPEAIALGKAGKNNGDHETVLVIDDEEVICQVLSEYLAQEGFPVLTAGSGQEGVELYERHKPAIVVTDVCMPGMDGLAVLRAIRRQDVEAKVVIMTGFGDEMIGVEALRAGASNYIRKPLSLEELLFIIRAHERMHRAQQRRRLPTKALVEERKVVSLPNDLNAVYAAACYLTQDLGMFLSHQEVEAISLSMTECMINAIEHGNLGVGYQQKSEALRAGAYQNLLEERMADPELDARRVRLEFEMTPQGMTVTVSDEGEGFDWRNRPNPNDPENLLKEHGRGLSIIHLFMDEVSFNDSGSEIRMRKAFSDPDSSEAPGETSD